MCKYVKPNVLYSDVLKNAKLLGEKEQSIQHLFSCVTKKQGQDNAGRSRNAGPYSSNNKIALLPSNKRQVSKPQCVSHMRHNVTNTVKKQIKSRCLGQSIC